jgi:hypothetical protein
LISSSICFSFFCLIIEIEDRSKRELYSEWSSLFVCSMSSYIYIRLKSVLSLLSRRKAPYLYLSMSANEKKINIYKGEKDRENTFSFVLLPFLSDL